jgi:hypothetical protein
MLESVKQLATSGCPRLCNRVVGILGENLRVSMYMISGGVCSR